MNSTHRMKNRLKRNKTAKPAQAEPQSAAAADSVALKQAIAQAKADAEAKVKAQAETPATEETKPEPRRVDALALYYTRNLDKSKE